MDEFERRRMVGDAILAERTAAMFMRRYPAVRPESLEFVIGELSSFARSMRRKSASPGRSKAEESRR